MKDIFAINKVLQSHSLLFCSFYPLCWNVTLLLHLLNLEREIKDFYRNTQKFFFFLLFNFFSQIGTFIVKDGAKPTLFTLIFVQYLAKKGIIYFSSLKRHGVWA